MMHINLDALASKSIFIRYVGNVLAVMPVCHLLRDHLLKLITFVLHSFVRIEMCSAVIKVSVIKGSKCMFLFQAERRRVRMTSASVLLQGLTWGRNCSHDLATMREKGILCDTTIIGSDNRKMKAHACVLAAASPILKTLLANRRGCKTIKSEISSHLWQMILKFVYTSEVLVPLDDIMSLKDIHHAAKALDIVGLRDAAREFISEDMLLMTEQELNKMQPGPMSPGFHSIVSLAFNKHPLESSSQRTQHYEKQCFSRCTQTKEDGCSENIQQEEEEEGEDDVVEVKVPVICTYHCIEEEEDDPVLSSTDDSQQASLNTSQEEVTSSTPAAEEVVVTTPRPTTTAPVPSSSSTPRSLPINITPDANVINVNPHDIRNIVENGQVISEATTTVVASSSTGEIQTVDTTQLGIKKEGHRLTHQTPAEILDAAMREIGDMSVSEDEHEEMPEEGLGGSPRIEPRPNPNRRVKLVKRPELAYRTPSPVDKSAPVYCPVCNKLLKNGAHSLNAHMTVHRKENPLKCEWCDYSTHKEGDFRKHKATHTGEKAFKCDQCKYSTNRPHDLKMHMKRHAGEKPYGCKSCGKTFVKKSELKTHMMTHSGEKPHQCDYCEKSFRRRYDLSSHLLTHTDEKPYCCELCKMTFKRKKEVEDHFAVAHTDVALPEGGAEPEPFRCNDCGFTTRSKRSLQAHVAASHSDAGFRCDRCNKSFASKPMYLSHLKSHTGRPYECQHCGEDMETQLRLKAHLASEHGERLNKLVCALCSKEYPNKNAFNTHMHKVHRKNPYMCHICGAIFKYAVNLRTHEMFHRGEKPHECLECGKKFTQKLDLKRHKMVHTGEKPFVCSYCPFATTRKGYLKIHEMSHTGMKPHVCTICAERFKIRSDLKIHMKKVHDIEIPMKVSRLQPTDGIKVESDEEMEMSMEMEEDEYTFREGDEDDEEDDGEDMLEEEVVEGEINSHDMGIQHLIEVPMDGVVAAQQVVYQEGDVPDAKTAENALQMAEEAAMQQYTVTLAAESLAELSQYVVNPEHLVQQHPEQQIVNQQQVVSQPQILTQQQIVSQQDETQTTTHTTTTNL